MILFSLADFYIFINPPLSLPIIIIIANTQTPPTTTPKNVPTNIDVEQGFFLASVANFSSSLFGTIKSIFLIYNFYLLLFQGGDDTYTYGKECDLWSCGVILFILLGGYPPFDDDSEPGLFRLIRSGKYDMGDPVWKAVSDNAKDIIKHLLVVDPSQRLTIQGVLDHPWMKPDEDLEKRTDLLGTVKKLRRSMRTKKLSF